MHRDLPKYFFNNTSGTSGLEVQSLAYFTACCNPAVVEIHHRVDFYVIIFFTEGHGRHSVDFETHTYEPGTLLFLTKNQVTAFTLNRKANGFLIYFTEAFYQQHQIQFNELLYTYPFNTGLYEPVLHLKSEINTFVDLFNSLQKDYMSNPTAQAQELHQCYLRILLLKIRMAHKKRYRQIVQADQGAIQLFIQFQRRVDESFTTNRNANFYCDALKVSFKKLNDLCKKLTQKTLKQYIDDRLILEAKRSLTYQQLNISEIAYNLGFEEVTNFTKYFKRHVRQSPLEFRQSLKKGFTIFEKD